MPNQALSDYVCERSTIGAYRWARRNWLAYAMNARRASPQPLCGVKGYQRELAWWRNHCREARQALSYARGPEAAS